MDERAKLRALIEKGTRAKDLKEFIQEWMEAEERTALIRLRDKNVDVEMIRADLLACDRLAGFLVSIMNHGTLAERKEKMSDGR